MTDELTSLIRTTLMPGFVGPTLPEWLEDELDAGLGSVCLFGTNVVDPDQTSALTAAIHDANPLAIVTMDEEGGDVTRLHHRTGSPWPAMAYLGRIDDEGLTEAVGFGIGSELRAVGVDLNFAPDADVNADPRNPVIGVRSFGADAALVSRHVAAYTRGLQRAGVGAVAKHFPGHGDTATDSHLALPQVTVGREVLLTRDLVPFVSAVDAGTLGVMTSHILVPALDPERPATMSPTILELLRDDFGFEGAIVTDALDMAGASAHIGIPEAATRALIAGADLLCLGTRNTAEQVQGIVAHIAHAVTSGRLPEARLLDACGRITRLNRALDDLRDQPQPTPPGAPVLSSDGFWLRGPVKPVTAPLIVRLASAANIAAGDAPWGPADHLPELSAMLPGASTLTVERRQDLELVLAASGTRPLVVAGRDLARVPFLTEAVAVTLDRRPDAVIVDMGWPNLVDGPRLDIATFGSSRGTSLALLHLLSEGTL